MQDEVEVIIHLEAPPLPSPEEIVVNDVAEDTRLRQEAVLLELAPADFELTYRYLVMPALAGRISGRGVDKLSGDSKVVMVSPNTELNIHLAESVPLVHAPEVHAAGVNGSDVSVAVIDTGIDATHPDLTGDVVGQECFRSCLNGTNRQSGPGSAIHSPFNLPLSERNGHGSYVSGIITSAGSVADAGVAPGAGIFAYKVAGSQPVIDMDAVFMALDHILAVTLQRQSVGLPPLTPIINMSFGGGAYPAGSCATDQPLIDANLGYLRLFGVLPIASTGNDATKAHMEWPACSIPVLSAGATYDADVGYQDYYNAFGQLLCEDVTTAADRVACFSNSTTGLDMLGPGALLTAPWPGGGTLQGAGTSAAAPHAAAVAALLKQARPELTPDQIELRLKRTGKWVKDVFSAPPGYRWTPRVDARVALLGPDSSDYDLDGCSNQQEFGSSASVGGQRNPLDPWDFFDPDWNPLTGTGKNTAISLGNVLNVSGRFGASGDPNAPFDHTAPAGTYNRAFDRKPSAGPDAWNTGPPDGAIALGDVLAIAAQFGHGCVP